MTPALTSLEQKLLACQGMPARDVARANGMRISQVIEIWHDLKNRGVMPRSPAISRQFRPPVCTEQQLSLDQLDPQHTEGNW